MAYLSAPFIGAGAGDFFEYLEGYEEKQHFNNDRFNVMNDEALEWLGAKRHLQTSEVEYKKRLEKLNKFKTAHARVLKQTGVVIDRKIWDMKKLLEKEVFYTTVAISSSKEKIKAIEKKVGKDFIQKEISQYCCRVIKDELLAITLHPDNVGKLLANTTQ